MLLKTSPTNTTKIGSVTLRWNDSRRMVHEDDGDLDMRGDLQISLDCRDADLRDVSRAAKAAELFRRLTTHGDFLCPHSNLRLRPVGLDSVGAVLMQIWRGERKCDAPPVAQLASLDPQQYTDGGDEAVISITWLRDVAKAIQRYDSALCKQHGTEEWDQLHEVISGRAAALAT